MLSLIGKRREGRSRDSRVSQGRRQELFPAGVVTAVPRLERSLKPGSDPDDWSVILDGKEWPAPSFEADAPTNWSSKAPRPTLCVRATVLGAADIGYPVMLGTDAVCSSPDRVTLPLSLSFDDRESRAIKEFTQFIPISVSTAANSQEAHCRRCPDLPAIQW